ncbi:MAG: STAS domain-containing protein [Rhodospirillales bacterium]|nr:STAS domain-containing protein [Rhodospirillales bacterium]
MLISIEENINGLSVWFSGSMDHSDQIRLLDLAERLEASPALLCVFNLSELDHLDGTGLGMLLFVYDCALSAGKRVEIHGLQNQIKRLFRSEDFEMTAPSPWPGRAMAPAPYSV